MLIEGYFLEIRPVISQLSGIDLMVLVLSLTTAVSLLKTDCAIENQGDLKLDELKKDNYTSFFLRLFLLSFPFLLLFVFSLPFLSHAFRRGRATLGLSGNR